MKKVREMQAMKKKTSTSDMSPFQRKKAEMSLAADQKEKNDVVKKPQGGVGAMLQAKLKANLKKQITAKILENKKMRLTKLDNYEKSKNAIFDKIAAAGAKRK